MAEARQTQAWNVPKIWRCLSKDMCASSMIGTSLDSSKKVAFFSKDMYARGRMGTSLECSKKVAIFVKETNDRAGKVQALDCSKKVVISVNSVYGRGKRHKAGMLQKYGDVCQRTCMLVA